jgi:hypothetical protein
VIWITKAITLAEAVDQFLASMHEAAQRISQRHELLHAPA